MKPIATTREGTHNPQKCYNKNEAKLHISDRSEIMEIFNQQTKRFALVLTCIGVKILLLKYPQLMTTGNLTHVEIGKKCKQYPYPNART